MQTIRYISHTEAETKQIACNLGKQINLPAIVCLYGDLGTGKTVFTKGLATNLGIPSAKIKSPTFTFLRRHTRGKIKLYHFDFYRIMQADDLIQRDLEEALEDSKGLVVAEWAQNVRDILPEKRIDVECRYLDETGREYRVEYINHD